MFRGMTRCAYWMGIPALILLIAALALLGSLSFDAPDEFWRQKGELEAVEIEPAGGDSLYAAYRLTLTSSAGYRLRGYLRVPREEGQWPGLVVIGGVRTGRMAAELITPLDPHVILGLDYPWDGPRELSWWQFLIRVLAVRRAMLLTPSAVLLAIDYLETRSDVDMDGIVLAGASFGAPLMIVAGAIDERPASVLSIYGGGDYAQLLRGSLRVRPSWLRGVLAEAGAWLIAPLEPLDYAADISPRPLVIINGRLDDRIPVHSVEMLYDAARAPKRLAWLDEGHISSRDPQLLERVLQAAVEALDRQALPGDPEPRRPADGNPF